MLPNLFEKCDSAEDMHLAALQTKSTKDFGTSKNVLVGLQVPIVSHFTKIMKSDVVFSFFTSRIATAVFICQWQESKNYLLRVVMPGKQNIPSTLNCHSDSRHI